MLILACGKPPENKASKNTTDSANNHAALQKSMKGFDLYAWKKDGNIFFTLLPGTNRNKTTAEIYDTTKAVEGLNAIENKIAQIDSGQYIFLKPFHVDTSELTPLISYMKRKKLNVTIMPEQNSGNRN